MLLLVDITVLMYNKIKKLKSLPFKYVFIVVKTAMGGWNMLKILVLEDNVEERDYLCSCIRHIVADGKILSASSAKQALLLMKQHFFDLFFIDVELQGNVDGFEFAGIIRKEQEYAFTPIVFTTAVQTNKLEIHRRYHHYEYVEKPFTFSQFQDTVGMLLDGLNRQKIGTVKSVIKKEEQIVFESRRQTLFINLSDILFAETSSRCLQLIMKDNTIYTDIKIALSEFVHFNVDSPDFMQCHKSFAVNLKNVRSVEVVGRRLWQVEFIVPVSHPCYISSTYYDAVVSQLSKQAQR